MRNRKVQGPVALLAEHGDAAYFGEDVSVLEHGLQAAYFAERTGAPSNEIVAALLHDVGHLLHTQGEDVAERGLDPRHEEIGCEYLSQWFDEDVVAPVRMHVAAKRYLCAVEPEYLKQLSESSVKSLQLQGGPMSAVEIAEFIGTPHAEAAVRLRRWDDEAKIVGLDVPGLEHYVVRLRDASRRPSVAHETAPSR